MSKQERRGRDESVRVLVVDDEADIRELLDLTLVRMGLTTDCAGSVAEARSCLERERYALCLTDMRLPDGDGLEIVRLIGSEYGQTPVAVITAFGSADNAVAALKAGAFDYLSKPVALESLRALIKSALNLSGAVGGVRGALEGSEAARQFIGDSPAVTAVREMIVKLARSQAPVYVSGESGTGKELAARLIHSQSARRTGPFVPVNCGAIPESLMESEFFGYRKGAFTGADADRDGFFQVAAGGTLFLDEVADLPLSMQVKLLRAIQEKKVRKVGSAIEESVDVRIISATHHKLQERVDAGMFRRDLYYRLNVIELKMPTLRERPEDISQLIDTIMKRLCGTSVPVLTQDARDALAAYSYPGNVRELENILERAVALCSGERISVADLQLSAFGEVDVAIAGASGGLDESLDRFERQLILDALAKTGFNRTAAARLLGVTFRSLRYRIERLGIDHG
ncbi:sigma-54-dependent transcriptional regulator [Propionivibrio dicarboxylicus]|uniref:Two-component system, NtrC family, response regulator PilR n=1 Tax=Propionivibrio dicarboxylicus TaxID=83767 RepID=A0A1G8FKW6_9RHOO|nr:sigma-54 dependent transcriptional regulator [Propionivibrio dicarboxylicus]SDH82666.1 two-component system, NtrC family, response regulator PilR [Propionivibrio dicarboxylicus]